MGLKDFYKILKKSGYCPVAMIDFQGKSFVFDTKALIYRYTYGVPMHGNVVHDVTERIDRLLQRMKSMGAKKIILACDGTKVPKEKEPTLLVRKKEVIKRKQRAEVFEVFCKRQKLEDSSTKTVEEKCQEEEKNAEILDKKKRQARKVTNQEVNSILSGLAKCGHDVFVAKEEADFALSYLSKMGIIDYVVADDADLLLSCSNVIRGLPAFVSDRTNRVPAPLVYNHNDILISMEMSKEQLTQLACIIGCDYQPSIGKVGSVTAVKAIKKHKTVKNFINSWTDKEKAKFKLPSTPETYHQQVCRSAELLTCHWPDKDALIIKYQPDSIRAKMLIMLLEIEKSNVQ